MPELPEVEVIARGLDERLAGRCIEHAELSRPDLLWRPVSRFAQRLQGRRVREVVRRGKYLLVRLDEATLLIHLGMSGQLWLSPRGEPRRVHTHLVLRVEGEREEVRLRDPRRFGGLDLLSKGEEESHPRLARLAPDPFALSPAEFAARVHSHHSPVKAVLLQQSVVAGLGNIYVDESLWAARLHPVRLADTIPRPRLTELHGELVRILDRAIAFGGSSISDFVSHLGRPGYFQNEHRVYGKAGQPCPRCERPLVKIVVAQRGTTLCPRCQRKVTGDRE